MLQLQGAHDRWVFHTTIARTHARTRTLHDLNVCGWLHLMLCRSCSSGACQKYVVHVGKSPNSGTKRVTVKTNELKCDADSANKGKRVAGGDHDDKFNVTVLGKVITVTRPGENSWGMDLSIQCCKRVRTVSPTYIEYLDNGHRGNCEPGNPRISRKMTNQRTKAIALETGSTICTQMNQSCMGFDIDVCGNCRDRAGNAVHTTYWINFRARRPTSTGGSKTASCYIIRPTRAPTQAPTRAPTRAPTQAGVTWAPTASPTRPTARPTRFTSRETDAIITSTQCHARHVP